MKKAALYAKAEHAYVIGQQSYEEAAAALGLSERTLRTWGEEGRWKEKRQAAIEQHESLDEKLYAFVNRLMDTILTDWQGGGQVDPGRLYALTRLIDKLEKARKFEGEVRAEKGELENAAREASEEEITAKVMEVLGICPKPSPNCAPDSAPQPAPSSASA